MLDSAFLPHAARLAGSSALRKSSSTSSSAILCHSALPHVTFCRSFSYEDGPMRVAISSAFFSETIGKLQLQPLCVFRQLWLCLLPALQWPRFPKPPTL